LIAAPLLLGVIQELENDKLQADLSISAVPAMSLRATLAQLMGVLAATPIHLSETALNITAVGLTTDTRSLKPGEVFLALRGENFDGHQFVEAAIAQGAIAAITDPASRLPDSIPQLQVRDTLAAYQALGRWWREQFSIPVIAITGSVGKTTTKELIAAVLGIYGPVLKTQANYNNEIGVPKTLLELGPEHVYAVIEMGMRGPGEIACLSRIARPDIAVITNVGTAHIGRLGSREAIAQAKCELLAEMPQKTSIAVLNAENSLLLETAKTVWQGQTLTYGLENGDLRGRLVDEQTLEVEGTQFPLPLPGDHNALNFLAALAITKLLRLDWSALTKGLSVNLPSGRAQRYTLANDVVILDETYNAGPESMEAALRLLAQTSGQRHIAVLGPMKELGEHSWELHRQIGKVVHQLNLDSLLILGTDLAGTAFAEGAFPVKSQQFSSHEALVEYLRKFVKSGDRLLFKASHSIGLEQVVEQLRNSFPT
jgi:UDP-N-acetylmuramoyl-tripeptide--D-alanyl-D-alanine ligase